MKKDETNKRYGRLLVIRDAGSQNKQALWLCKCDCGRETTVRGYSLRCGDTKSCGCLHSEISSEYNKSKGINEAGNKYGKLTVLSKSSVKNECWVWLCKCDCGNETIVKGSNLRCGQTKSCGCLRSDLRKELNPKQAGINHPRYTDGARCGWSTKEQKEFHESIRKRDNYTCQRCNKTQEQELADIGWRLSVHHKNGDHFHNTDENTTTLCQSCHKILEAEISRAAQDASLLNTMYNMDKDYYV